MTEVQYKANTAASATGRHQLVRAAAARWKEQLTDVSGRNRLLYYRDLKQGTLDLSPDSAADPDQVAALLATGNARLSELFPREEADLAPQATRARTIDAKARENFEERGLRTLALAWGMATWKNNSDGPTPAAPVLLREVELRAHSGAGHNFDLKLSGTWEVNPSLLHYLRNEYGIDIDADDLLAEPASHNAASPDEDRRRAETAWAELTRRCTNVALSVEQRVVLGNFSYAKLPMVQDIDAALASGQLAEHPLLAAVARDPDARATLRTRGTQVDEYIPDHIPPRDEYLVMDADASQSYVINAVASGNDLVVEGPPGTGKSQTIANLIATLSARGQRVLFVAEKRAAIDAVVDRLAGVDLAELVLDLHGGAGSRRALASDLERTLRRHAAATGVDESNHSQLTGPREQLANRNRELHARRDPWGLSVYDLQARLLGIPGQARLGHRVAQAVLDGLTPDMQQGVREDLRRYLELGGPALVGPALVGPGLVGPAAGEGGASPWAGAFQAGTITSPEQARRAADLVNTVLDDAWPTTQRHLGQLVADCGLTPPPTLGGYRQLFQLLHSIAQLQKACAPTLYAAPLATLATDLAPARRRSVGRMIGRVAKGRYRRARAQARSHWRGTPPSDGDLLTAVEQAAAHLAHWQSMGPADGPGTAPHLPAGWEQADHAYTNLLAQLAELAGFLGHARPATPTAAPGPDPYGTHSYENLTFAAIDHQLDALRHDHATLRTLPELHQCHSRLANQGLAPLAANAAQQGLGPEQAAAAFDHAWMSSALDALELAEPSVGSFAGTTHHRVVNEFVAADRHHIATGPARVRRAVAERAVAMRDRHPDESTLITHQARLKRGHLPVRTLFQDAPNVLGAVKPCWAMSPLVVAQLLPPERHFDVVIFDEASQVRPAEAIGALLRADRAVVAGDTKQLPPTAFFDPEGLDGLDEHPDGETDGTDSFKPDLTQGMESILDAIGALLPARVLEWHYRSRDERLIAFSNAQPSLYNWSLTTFPGVHEDGGPSHELVPWQPDRPAPAGSASAEVERVVELILAHARDRPDESLGVIAMGLKHAERIGETLRRARADNPQLDTWFNHGPEGRQEPFFVKNLERVQGDERDAIILTVGYGRGPDGRLRYQFGPINQEGGERRLNVAVTRSRQRMTVVSSFGAAELDPNKLRSEGAQMLGRYLAYAESSGRDLGEVNREAHPLNPFERDVQQRLEAAGMSLVPQFGASGYRIDFAAQHPDRPGQMVLAIECDGATYHSSATARDRDRLRQEHLERLGWTFHRIWSTDWFRDPGPEVERTVAAWRRAVDAVDAVRAPSTSHTPGATGGRAQAHSSAPPGAAPAPKSSPDGERSPRFPGAATPAAASDRPTPRPPLPAAASITDYRHEDLVALVRWVESDRRLRTEDELLTEMIQQLGFKKRGRRIVEAVTAAIRAARAAH